MRKVPSLPWARSCLKDRNQSPVEVKNLYLLPCFLHIFDQTQSLHKFLSQLQSALPIATIISINLLSIKSRYFTPHTSVKQFMLSHRSHFWSINYDNKIPQLVNVSYCDKNMYIASEFKFIYNKNIQYISSTNFLLCR